MKLSDWFKGKPTRGAANRVVVTDIEKLKADDREDLSKQLDIPKSVLEGFLELLKIRQVDVAPTDSTLREMAKQYTIFYERVVQVAAADSVVTELQSQAVGALAEARFDRAEALLNEASDHNVRIAQSAPEEEARERFLAAAARKAAKRGRKGGRAGIPGRGRLLSRGRRVGTSGRRSNTSGVSGRPRSLPHYA